MCPAYRGVAPPTVEVSGVWLLQSELWKMCGMSEVCGYGSHLRFIWCKFDRYCMFLRREEREAWIRAKYEQKLFLAPAGALSDGPDGSLWARLCRAVTDRDLPRLLLLLAHSTKEEINAPPPCFLRYGSSALHEPPPPLHAACQLGDAVMTQLLIWVRTRNLNPFRTL